nr:ribonuclease H-like domain-containing protein [Tanacetum cinerariifolium]
MVTLKSSVKIYAPVKENNGAPLIKDWELDEDDEVESLPKKDRKTVEPCVDKVEVKIPKQNDKPARRPVKYTEMYRPQRPRGNQKNWNNLKSHQVGNISYLTDFKEFYGGYVAFGGGAKGGKITGKGTIRTGKLDFKDVYFVKELQFNLFSVSQMCDKKNSVLLTDTECFVLSPDFKLADESHVLLKVPRKNNIFTWVFFLATKDETSRILKSFTTEIENLVDKKVKIIRCDDGTKFKNRVMNDFCKEKGIKREYIIARTPQQNGVAERRNKTLIKAARTMLANSKLPITFWAEAVNTACYVQNWVLVVKPHFKTPYELFRGRTPALSTTSNDFAGKGVSFDASCMETRPSQDYILMPLRNDGSLFVSSLKASDGDKQDNDGPSTESEIDNQDRPNAEHNTKDVNTIGLSINTTSSNINYASLTVNTVRQSDDFFGADDDMRSLDRVELDISNIFTTYLVPATLNTRINKDHSLDNVIGDIQFGVKQEG